MIVLMYFSQTVIQIIFLIIQNTNLHMFSDYLKFSHLQFIHVKFDQLIFLRSITILMHFSQKYLRRISPNSKCCIMKSYLARNRRKIQENVRTGCALQLILKNNARYPSTPPFSVHSTFWLGFAVVVHSFADS
jgi:hypothetical protein